MRIVIDMQGAQASSVQRGIGSYTMGIAQAIARNRGPHEVTLALNGLFPGSIEVIRAAFDDILSQDNIRAWDAPGPVSYANPDNRWRREVAEQLRESFLASLRPDIVLVSSLFEGWGDNAVTSIGKFTPNVPTAIILYDLIPYVNPQIYLQNPTTKDWYMEKLVYLKRAHKLLAISEASRREAIDQLGLPTEQVVTISTAVKSFFCEISIADQTKQTLCAKYGLKRPFLMYTGGIDYRKNIEGLIRAYARLPEKLRRGHQLAIVCAAQDTARRAFQDLAQKEGLSADEIVLTGFVSDEDLRALYNVCKVFVFPSIHEGFGLPVLEAMQCGAPVIGSNRSSIPEVLGLEGALFDPLSDEAITRKLEQTLQDDEFRASLARHGLQQCRKFSWDKSGRRTIRGLENLHAEHRSAPNINPPPKQRPKLAYISPLPPERSGISDYSAELLPELSKYYDIEVIVNQETVADEWVKKHCPIRTVDWFKEHAGDYDRILYHFGNSSFHAHMFGLLEQFPGMVVLHDFFLSGIKAHREIHDGRRFLWRRALYGSHGYEAVRESFCENDAESVIFKYPCNFDVIEGANGIIAHSEYAIQLARRWYGDACSENWSVIPQLRTPERVLDHGEARRRLGIGPDEFIVCSFGIIGPTKMTLELLEAWLRSSLSSDKHCRLIFVGCNHGGGYGEEIKQRIKEGKSGGRIDITGWVDTESFKRYLAVANMAVQLRTLSRGETSRAILDCMAYGLPTIINANGAQAELPDDAVWKLPDALELSELASALEILHQDKNRRETLGKRAQQYVLRERNPPVCAESYAQAIETAYSRAETSRMALIEAISEIDDPPSDDTSLKDLAQAIAANQPDAQPARQLLVDISELIQRDVKTGIQRVVRSILLQLLRDSPKGWRIEPVFATTESEGYRYARSFTLKFLDCPPDGFEDAPVETSPGDIFLGLDLHMQVIPAQAKYLKSLRACGVQVFFVVYDLLPVLHPEIFPGVEATHTRWLDAITQFDGAVCISKSVAEELRNWLESHGEPRLREFKVGWFHLGCDIEHSAPSRGWPEQADQISVAMNVRSSFLMVGTLEPRKSHMQVVRGFEQLWKRGFDINLVIVGKQGWMVGELCARLTSHPENKKRLFWIDQVSDEYLEHLYESATCLLAASIGEGFGLPLVEASKHDLPIIARDIPVFREVMGQNASYFHGEKPDQIVDAISGWLDKYESGQHCSSGSISYKTWQDSTQDLTNIVLHQQWPTGFRELDCPLTKTVYQN